MLYFWQLRLPFTKTVCEFFYDVNTHFYLSVGTMLRFDQQKKEKGGMESPRKVWSTLIHLCLSTKVAHLVAGLQNWPQLSVLGFPVAGFPLSQAEQGPIATKLRFLSCQRSSIKVWCKCSKCGEKATHTRTCASKWMHGTNVSHAHVRNQSVSWRSYTGSQHFRRLCTAHAANCGTCPKNDAHDQHGSPKEDSSSSW